jgi:hypothetical protein
MLFPEDFCNRLKWAIYEWIGAISVHELTSNRKLAREIQALCKTLSSISA